MNELSLAQKLYKTNIFIQLENIRETVTQLIILSCASLLVFTLTIDKHLLQLYFFCPNRKNPTPIYIDK